MIHKILSLLIIIISAITMNATTPPGFATPDFAFPQTVIETSLAELKKADKSSNPGLVRLRYTLEYLQAVSRINPDNILTTPQFVAEQANSPHLTNNDKAIFAIIQAKQILDCYKLNSRYHDQLKAPAEPIPDSMSNWTEEHFATNIKALLDKAAALATNAPLETYADILKTDELSFEYCSTVADFISVESIDLIDNCYLDCWDKEELTQTIIKRATERNVGSPAFFYWQCKDNNSFKETWELYQKYADVEAARYALIKAAISAPGFYISLNSDNDDLKNERQRAMVAEAIDKSLIKFPNWQGNNELKNALGVLRQSIFKISCARMCAPGESVVLQYVMAFTDAANIKLYKTPADGKLTRKPDYPPIQEFTIKSSNPVGIVRDSIKFAIEEIGNYYLFIDANGDPSRQPILCTPFIPIAATGLDKYAIITTDLNSGEPFKDVDVNFKLTTQPYSIEHVGKTDKDGKLTIRATDIHRELIFALNGNEIDFEWPYYTSDKPSERTASPASITITDRAIYHLGDSVKWMTAVAKGLNDKGKTMPNEPIKVFLIDANDEVVDSISCITDEFGRCYGNFNIPKDRLTGYWKIRVELVKHDIASYKSFTVSDFRIPTFEAKVESIKRDAPSRGDVTICGSARSFSGMPIIGANIDINIYSAERLFYFWETNEYINSLTVITDDNGNFTAVIPAQLLSGEYDSFIAKITVTATSGEAIDTSARFTTGKPYTLFVNSKTELIDSDKPFVFTLHANDADSKVIPIAIKWKLVGVDGARKDEIVCSGVSSSGNSIELSLTDIPAATYRLSIAPADSSLADPIDNALEVTTYNERLNLLPPTAKHLFVPTTSYTLKKGKTEILIATPDDKAYVYALLRTGINLEYVKLHEIKQGFKRLSISAEENSTLHLISVFNGDVSESEITLNVPAPKPCEIIASSFRDKLVPGSDELWTLRLVDGKGKGLPNIPVVATMYNKALDALTGYNLPKHFNFNRSFCYLELKYRDNYDCSSSCESRYHYPRFNPYMPEFLFEPIYRHRSVPKYGMSLKMLSNSDEEEEFEILESSADMATSTMKTSNETTVSAQEDFKDIDYRNAEVLQAFWKPTLIGDADGNVNLVFTVPNANTTWQLHALAWTPGAQVLNYSNTALANKPIMVQPNLPRFMRQGDYALVRSTIFNNNNDSCDVNVRAEIFDINTNDIIDSISWTIPIAPQGSSNVDMPVIAPINGVAIGFRVSASAEGFSDGEQAAIPIIAAATTVIESSQFYLNPSDSKPFTFDIKSEGEATITLQYIQNPIWTIVKAMRGVYNDNESSSTTLASNMFSYLAARHIVSTTPAIAHVLEQWKTSETKSMLERNDNLKHLLLTQTPWVQAAKSNSNRIAMLSQLLDSANVNIAITKAKDNLISLQKKDGGFAWTSWSEKSNVWCTESVLQTFAIANALGIVDLNNDPNFASKLQKAFDYLQNEAVQPKMPRTNDDLTLIAALIPQFSLSEDAKIIVDNTVTHIINNWKNGDVTDKAYNVLILNAFGHRDIAEEIMASIRQFAVTTANEGTSFPSVTDIRAYATIIQAYATMNAPKNEIDALRQWVIIRAQATDDLGTWNPDYVIAAILFTGNVWTDVPVDNNVTINGSPLDIDETDAASGYFAQQLPPFIGNASITITPNGVTPSYGSVISIFSKQMISIEAHDGKDISIRKSFLVKRNDEWVETDSFTLGERVRVQLIINAKRDLEYVIVGDERAAAFEPVKQLPELIWDGATCYYRENLDASTRLFFDYLRKGSYCISYEMTANVCGTFICGAAAIQSQYAPEITAHSNAYTIFVK